MSEDIEECPGTDPELDISILVDLKQLDPEFMFYEYNIIDQKIISNMIERANKDENTKEILYGFINRKNPDLFTKKAISTRFFDKTTNMCLIYKTSYLVLDIRRYKKNYNINWVYDNLINNKKTCLICNKFTMYNPADICEKCGGKICAICYLKMNNKYNEYFRCVECNNFIQVKDIIITPKEKDQVGKFNHWKMRKELLENMII